MIQEDELYNVIACSEGICQSCQKKEVEWSLIGKRDSEEDLIELDTYNLCEECGERFFSKSLRPLEIYNLLVLRGKNFSYYTHDDFYDYGTGEADQPETEVVDAEKYPYPRLKDVQNNLSTLIDYGYLVNQDYDKVCSLLKKVDKEILFHLINSRLKENLLHRLRSVFYYKLATDVFEPEYISDWIREEWKHRKEYLLPMYSDILLKVLPKEEVFDLIMNELEDCGFDIGDQNDLRTLADTNNSKTLDWIERQAERIKNISNIWGYLASKSSFTWSRAYSWLIKGRPLSLIALDALGEIFKLEDEKYKEGKKLLDVPSDIKEIELVLSDYLNTDNVPRTRKSIKFILSRFDNL